MTTSVEFVPATSAAEDITPTRLAAEQISLLERVATDGQVTALGVARRFTNGDTHDAKDNVQMAYLKIAALMAKSDAYDDKSSDDMRKILNTAVHNKSLDNIRDRGRRAMPFDPLDFPTGLAESSGEDPIAGIVRNNLQEYLKDVTEDQRSIRARNTNIDYARIFELRFVQGHSNKACAEILELKPVTFRTQLHRMINLLRRDEHRTALSSIILGD